MHSSNPRGLACAFSRHSNPLPEAAPVSALSELGKLKGIATTGIK
jgi:hypothetical protein